MSKSNRRNTDFLDITAKHIKKRFGNSLGFTAQKHHGCLHADRIAPQDGGEVCKFDDTKLGWFSCGQDSTNWNIEESGKVRVSYSQRAWDDSDLNFQIGHPQEVAELLHLFVQPGARLTAEIPKLQVFRLGKIADLYAVIASKDGLRVLDLSRLPATMPEDVRTSLTLTLTWNQERLAKAWNQERLAKGCRIWKLEDRWLDFVNVPPNAAPYLRAGYYVDLKYWYRLGYSLLQGATADSDMFSGFLLVPHDDVSSFYLGEYFEYDYFLRKHMRNAFAENNHLEMVYGILKNIPIFIPSDFTDQVKLAAQTNLLRVRLVDRANKLVYRLAPYRDMSVRYQAAGHELGRILDAW